MPNWCSNRLDITLNNAADMPALKRWIEAADGIPAWRIAIAQSLHLLLAGCAGILKPVKPIDFPPLPALTSYAETGIVSPGNTAFTHWIEMLMTAPDLDMFWQQQRQTTTPKREKPNTVNCIGLSHLASRDR